jgi:flagellar basal body-associated protein FliL
MFGDPEAGRRSRFWVTLIAVIVTILALAIAAGAVYLLWSAFTIYQRHHPS